MATVTTLEEIKARTFFGSDEQMSRKEKDIAFLIAEVERLQAENARLSGHFTKVAEQ